MAIDKADWHSGGDYPKELPPENGGTHIGMFLAWIIHAGLQGELHNEESQADLEAVRARRMTGREFLLRVCDGKFWEDDLNEEGNRFAAAYYLGEGGKGYGAYIEDYERTLAAALPTIYHVEDSWENYDAIALVIGRRHAAWRTACV